MKFYLHTISLFLTFSPAGVGKCRRWLRAALWSGLKKPIICNRFVKCGPQNDVGLEADLKLLKCETVLKS